MKSNKCEGGCSCTKCGLTGSFDWVKSQECQSAPQPDPVQPERDATPANHTDHVSLLAAELEKALEAGNQVEAKEIVTLLELHHDSDTVEDQEMALQIMEEEMKMLEMMEQLQQLELGKDEEQEAIQLAYAVDLSLKESQVSPRPPATPSTSVTPLPSVKEPAQCI